MAAPQGIAIAPDDATLEGAPSWTRLDTSYNVTRWTVDRGRSYELERTNTGTASVELVDKAGDFDPTNPASTFYGRLDALTQAAVALQNPTDSSWDTLFRGFVASVQYEPYQNQQFANVRLDLVDGLALLAAAEMTADGTFGDTVTAGNIVFAADPGLDAVQTRINLVLDQFGWPSALREIFTGNVSLQQTVYAPRTPVLVVIQESAEAEFPTVANVYVQKDGRMTFHGRFARFAPDNPDYHIATWQVGDDAAATASPASVVRLSPPLRAYRDDQNIYTAAIATPYGIADSNIAGQYVEDTAARSQRGLRTWSAENLRTGDGSGTDPLQETLKFATYITDNYASPRTRVGQLTFRPQGYNRVYGAATWALMGGVDVSDVVEITTTQHGGGGFSADQFYVEGVHYTSIPMNANQQNVTLTLDVSPTGYYASNPF